MKQSLPTDSFQIFTPAFNALIRPGEQPIGTISPFPHALAAKKATTPSVGTKTSATSNQPEGAKMADACEAANVLNAIAWPAVALLIIVVFAGNRSLSREIKLFINGIIRTAKLKTSLLELEFTPEAAKDVKTSIKNDLQSYIKAADIEYEQQVRIKNLVEVLANAKRALMTKLEIDEPHLVRATIHVPDVVLAEHLYQLTDYTPDGYGMGRRLSERFGILGRAWRLNQSLCTNRALTISPDQARREEELIQFWGMTREEAQSKSALNTSSCLCILLREEYTNLRVGVFYLACNDADKFKLAVANEANQIRPDQNALPVLPRIEALTAIQGLSRCVNAALKELKRGATYLSLME